MGDKVCSYCGEEASNKYVEEKSKNEFAQCECCASDADIINKNDY